MIENELTSYKNINVYFLEFYIFSFSIHGMYIYIYIERMNVKNNKYPWHNSLTLDQQALFWCMESLCMGHWPDIRLI